MMHMRERRGNVALGRGDSEFLHGGRSDAKRNEKRTKMNK